MSKTIDFKAEFDGNGECFWWKTFEDLPHQSHPNYLPPYELMNMLEVKSGKKYKFTITTKEVC